VASKVLGEFGVDATSGEIRNERVPQSVEVRDATSTIDVTKKPRRRATILLRSRLGLIDPRVARGFEVGSEHSGGLVRKLKDRLCI